MRSVRLALPSLLAALLVLAVAAPVFAQDGAPDIQQFKPVSDMHGFMLVHDASTLPQFRPGFALTLNYGHAPLEVNAPGFGRQFGIVDGIFGGDLTAAFGIFDFWEVGLLFPFMQIPLETAFITSPSVNGRKVGYGIGDLKLETRLRILDERADPIGLAANLFLTLPTGNRLAGLGRGKPGGGARFILSKGWDRVRFAVNLGYAFYPRATVANLTTGDEFTYGAAVAVSPIIDQLDIMLEFDGSLTPGPNDRDGKERFFNPAHSPLEALLGIRYRMANGFGVHGGVGKGLTPGFGTTDFRVFAGVSWAVLEPVDRDKDGINDSDDECPRDPEDFDEFEDTDGCPEPDNDADGILDAADECPNDAEDMDGWEDEDGCPDPDNDGDGVPDTADHCMNEPEDLDGFQDQDGCAELDNDADGILDTEDACPNEAETVDGWEDTDGCPDPDNDGDSIPDEQDLCPNEPEVFNGESDDDGCPDDMLAIRYGDEIKILQKVEFVTGSSRVRSNSDRIVKAVAKILLASPEIMRIRVEGHTDNRGGDSSNLRLSKARAATVMKRLTELGVEKRRLESEGYGDTKPIASNRTDAGRQSNRRVQFLIVSTVGGSTSPTSPAPPGPAPSLDPTPSPWGQPAAPPPDVAPAANPWGAPVQGPAKPNIQGADNPWGAKPSAAEQKKAEEKKAEEKPEVKPVNPWGN